METGDVLVPRAADASVRPARAGDAGPIGAVQIRCWRRALAGVLPALLLQDLPPDDLAAAWHAAVTAPPSARHAVFVACAGAAVVGFAALAPSTDGDAGGADAELIAFEVDPAHQRAGHGSRLLSAVAETAREQGFSTLRVWVPEADRARRAFFETAGPRPDGARRRLRLGSDGAPEGGAPDGDGPVEIVEERLAASLGD